MKCCIVLLIFAVPKFVKLIKNVLLSSGKPFYEIHSIQCSQKNESSVRYNFVAQTS